MLLAATLFLIQVAYRGPSEQGPRPKPAAVLPCASPGRDILLAGVALMSSSTPKASLCQIGWTRVTPRRTKTTEACGMLARPGDGWGSCNSGVW
jgi:hypothetical protein